MKAPVVLLGLVGLVTLLLLAPIAHADTGRERRIVRTDTAMGTVVQITFWTDDEEGAARTAQAVFDEFRRLDAMMTTWTEESEVSQVNAAAGVKAVAVSEETFTVIARALDVSRRSKGIFDITVGAFQGLWKFDEDRDGTIPEADEVKRRLALVGWKNVVLDKKKRTVKLKKKGMKITLGGIAKGYAVDRAVVILRDAGFGDFILQAGGDMYVSGRKGSKPWVVGIRDPRGGRDESFAIAPIENRSFSTSGDYERYVLLDGVRYHHILDPRTGFPAKATRSVTVSAKDAFTADAWSKVLFILGPEKTKKLAAAAGLDTVFVTADNQVVVSRALDKTLKILAPPTDGP